MTASSPSLRHFLLTRFIDPTRQADFTQQIVNNIADMDEGHLCYKIGAIPQTVKAGTNATIQMEYWAEYEGENSGREQSFFACADVVRTILSLLCCKLMQEWTRYCEF